MTGMFYRFSAGSSVEEGDVFTVKCSCVNLGLVGEHSLELSGDKDHVIFDGERYEAIPTVKRKIAVHELPRTRLIEAVWDTGDFFIVLDRPKYGFTYESYRLYIGQADDLLEQSIARFSRMRDGGTTTIHLSSGDELYSPTSFRPELKPTYNGEPIVRVDPDSYVAIRHPKTQELMSLDIR